MAYKHVSSAHEFLSIKWFTKGEIFTSCFNFDLNRSASKKKRGSKMSIFKPCQKTFPPLVNHNEQGPSGGAQRKIDNIFIERKDDILLSYKQVFNC